MTREEAQKDIKDYSYSVIDMNESIIDEIDAIDTINKIYDDFESRTCETCKTKYCDIRDTLLSDNQIGIDYFSCNDWEAKPTLNQNNIQ